MSSSVYHLLLLLLHHANVKIITSKKPADYLILRYYSFFHIISHISLFFIISTSVCPMLVC